MKVLVVAPFAPSRSGRHGGSRAVADLIVGLAAHVDVRLAYVTDASDEAPGTEVRHACVGIDAVLRSQAGRGRRLRLLKSWVAGEPMWVSDLRSTEFIERVTELAERWRPEIIQIEFPATAWVLDGWPRCGVSVLTEHDPALPAAVDRVRTASGIQRIVAALDVIAWRRYLRTALDRVDAVVVFTERDRRAVHAITPELRTAPIPLDPPHANAALDPVGHGEPLLLFAGSYMHPPNVDAALRLIRTIGPSLRRAFPSLRLCLAGADPPASLVAAAQECPWIEVPGYLASLIPRMDEASVVVFPLRTGSGMRLKVVEALSAGKAVVATPRALEGLNVDPAAVATATSDADFVAAVGWLLADESERKRLAKRARSWAAGNRPSPARRARRYLELYDSLLRSKTH